MKIIRLLLLVAVAISVAIACDSNVDFGDINEDDDAVQEANAEGLLAGGMNQFFTLAGDYHITPIVWMQYQSQSVYTQEQRYAENASAWTGYYSGVLSNFHEVKELNTDDVDPETANYGDPDNQIAVSELMSVLVWKRVTDTWGPVPYENALGGNEETTPEYTDQETIYKDLITRVKDARDQINAGGQGPTGDVLYGGEMGQWERFANSLILSLSLQLSEVDEAYAEAEFTDALDHDAGVIESVDEEAWYEHANASGAQNPFSALRGADYVLSEPFTRAFQGTAEDSSITYSNEEFDERLNVFSSDPQEVGGPYGTNNGGISGPSIPGEVSGADAPLHYMTAAYTYLNRAEAAERGWNTGDNAEDMLVEGIEMSYATIDEHYDDGSADSGNLQSDGSDFAAERLADAQNVDMMQVIGEEKWAALFPQGFDAWAEWRRTGYPQLVPAPDATNDGNIPTRYLYPSEESGVNEENYDAGVEMLDPAEDSNTSHIWWDQ